VPRIIEYQTVLDRLISQGMTCLYPNGGAFGFSPETKTQICGWIGPADSTIKSSMSPLTRNIPAPYEPTLANLATQAWQQFLPGEAWIMPASHWSFELTHGNGEWLTNLLQKIHVDANQLIHRTSAAAIEFSAAEADPFRQLVQGLLENLLASDFLVAFPGHLAVCTLHHHKQLSHCMAMFRFA
jgi:hypothetical protein